MNVVIYDWAGQCTQQLKTLGHVSNEVIENISITAILDLTAKFILADLDVMVSRHHNGNNTLLIAVDLPGKRFRQR